MTCRLAKFTSCVMAGLRNKSKYVVHYRNLQLYMDLGIKVTNVHGVFTSREQTDCFTGLSSTLAKFPGVHCHTANTREFSYFFYNIRIYYPVSNFILKSE